MSMLPPPADHLVVEVDANNGVSAHALGGHRHLFERGLARILQCLLVGTGPSPDDVANAG